jgi:hypothetical protein
MRCATACLQAVLFEPLENPARHQGTDRRLVMAPKLRFNFILLEALMLKCEFFANPYSSRCRDMLASVMYSIRPQLLQNTGRFIMILLQRFSGIC